ncbi:MAG: hypothetical protein Q9191_008496, partial [Dirinaria sp. TL-2023a]
MPPPVNLYPGAYAFNPYGAAPGAAYFDNLPDLPRQELYTQLYSPGGYVEQASRRGIPGPAPDGSPHWEANWLRMMLQFGYLAPLAAPISPGPRRPQGRKPVSSFAFNCPEADLYAALHGPGGYLEQAEARG